MSQALRWSGSGNRLTLDPIAQNESLTHAVNGQAYKFLVARANPFKDLRVRCARDQAIVIEAIRDKIMSVQSAPIEALSPSLQATVNNPDCIASSLHGLRVAMSAWCIAPITRSNGNGSALRRSGTHSLDSHRRMIWRVRIRPTGPSLSLSRSRS